MPEIKLYRRVKYAGDVLNELTTKAGWDIETAVAFCNNIPDADAVEVVRCGECERRNKSADLTDMVYCRWLRLQMRKNDFCSYGERKKEQIS